MLRRDFARLGVAALGAGAAGAVHGTNGGGGREPFPATPGLTAYVAEFIATSGYASIPAAVIELGKKSILDGIGLALAGSRAESGSICMRYLDTVAASGRSTVIGTGRSTAPQFAALVNGISIHADDYDDTQLAVAKDRVYGLLTHPTVAVLPAAFAFAERDGRSGQDFMLAYHLGVEVECKIAEAIAPRHYEDGFHSTATCGPFGSAAACAKLLGLDAAGIRTALGIAGSASGGLRENFGTMTKPLQAGHAAQSGVVAAELAQLGWTAAQNILEAQRGFFHAAGGGYDPQAILQRLGKPWTFTTPGVSIKPYPSGSLSHPAMTELMRLITTHDLRPEQVVQLDIGGNEYMYQALLRHEPHDGLEAKFSMEFCMAILLLERKAGLPQFTDAVVQRPDVQDMIRKVKFHVDPRAASAGLNKMTSLISVQLKDGTTLTGEANFGKGSPADPMSYRDAAEKFRGCAEYAQWPKAKTEALIARVAELEHTRDMKELGELLRS